MADKYPTLKITNGDRDLSDVKVTLDGREIPGLVSMKISGSPYKGEVYSIELTVLAKLEVEITTCDLIKVSMENSGDTEYKAENTNNEEKKGNTQ